MQAPDDFDPPVGIAEVLEPGLRRIVAPNPSPMTYRGTNTYLLGERGLAVIDPGPDSAGHPAPTLDAVGPCLLYPADAADEEVMVIPGGGRTLKTKN